MTNSELLSILIAIAALLVAGFAAFSTRTQAMRATEALAFQQQIARGDSIMHFTDRFFDLLKSGEPIKKIVDSDWAYQFWSLHAAEFYFFHHGLLPSFMYSLWMIDLADLYGGIEGRRVRESHMQYLKEYVYHYDVMTSFYSELFKIATDYSDSATRNRKVADHVTGWIEGNKKGILS
jgi:hypothetical protein